MSKKKTPSNHKMPNILADEAMRTPPTLGAPGALGSGAKRGGIVSVVVPMREERGTSATRLGNSARVGGGGGAGDILPGLVTRPPRGAMMLDAHHQGALVTRAGLLCCR